jgi:hypothetical protein
MKNLFGDEATPGMLNNTSLVTLNLADNDLRDDNADPLLLFLQKLREKRDLDLWKASLRNQNIEDKIHYRV